MKRQGLTAEDVAREMSEGALNHEACFSAQRSPTRRGTLCVVAHRTFISTVCQDIGRKEAETSMSESKRERRECQHQVIRELGVREDFDADSKPERRIALSDYIASQGLRTRVLGISGGVDSSTAGGQPQLSIERLRACG